MTALDDPADNAKNSKPTPSYAPIYAAALYPELAIIARKHGYALAVHGSLQRDFDLVAIPWVESPSSPRTLLDEYLSTFDVRLSGSELGQPEQKLHGRIAWTVAIGFGECRLDISFMPTLYKQSL